MWEKAQKCMTWLFQTDLPKLYFWVTLGGTIMEDKAKEYIQQLQNTKSVHLGPGIHLVQEDHPHAKQTIKANPLSFLAHAFAYLPD